MSAISVLKVKNIESRQQDGNQETSDNQPISLLAFLEAENCRLRRTVAQLALDTMALREASQKNRPRSGPQRSDRRN